MSKKQLTARDLIKKIEKNSKQEDFAKRRKMYIAQTDRNYKDGDRN